MVLWDIWGCSNVGNSRHLATGGEGTAVEGGEGREVGEVDGERGIFVVFGVGGGETAASSEIS